MGKTKRVPEYAIVGRSITDGTTVGVDIGVFDTEDQEVFETYASFSRRHPNDKDDPVLGYELAFWRAVKNAADDNLARLAKRVQHNDDIRKAKKEAKAKAEAKANVIRSNRTQLFVGDEVTFIGDATPYEFRGKTGKIARDHGRNLFEVDHPEVNWCGNFTTFWPKDSLELI